jgi:membrane fusion protein, multidrug efflux system
MNTSIIKFLKLFTLILTGLIIFSSCENNDSESITALKEREAELKTELSEITEKIKKLEGDSGGRVTLVEATVIEPTIFKTYINLQGKVDAEESVSLSSEMPGTITKIYVKAGEQVSKGQVLAETDARMIQQSIADLQTNAELVNQLFEKQKALWEQKIGTEIQYLQAKTQKKAWREK